MGFQNENKLEMGASVKATINDKVVEAKVISVGFNRVTLRSEKGNEASYAFNSEKFLKWFHKVPLDAVKTAENSKERSTDDLLRGLKVARPSVKERTTDPKAPKEDKYKLDFDFPPMDAEVTAFTNIASLYANTERKRRLSALFVPMCFESQGYQASMVILHALTCASKLNKHSDLEWAEMLENRNLDECYWDSFDDMDKESVRLFCDLIVCYADDDMRGFDWKDTFAKVLPKEKSEAYFVAQLICDGGINKYGLSCAELTANLLADNLGYYGLLPDDEIDDEKVVGN